MLRQVLAADSFLLHVDETLLNILRRQNSIREGVSFLARADSVSKRFYRRRSKQESW